MDIVVSKQVHKLNPSFENQWDLINKRTLDTKYYENLYEVAHGLGRSGEMGYSTGVRINGASNKYGAKGNSSGNIRLTASYILSFDNNDALKYVFPECVSVIHQNNLSRKHLYSSVVRHLIQIL